MNGSQSWNPAARCVHDVQLVRARSDSQRSQVPYVHYLPPEGLGIDFPDDVVPLSGIEPSSPPRTESIDGFSTDSEAGSFSDCGSAAQPVNYPPSPSTPMPVPHPHPRRPKIAPLRIDKPTPPTPRLTNPSFPAPARSPLTRSRSDSAPSALASSSSRTARRRPIMLNDHSSLSSLSVYITSRDPAAEDHSLSTPDLYASYGSPTSSRSPVTRRFDKVKQLTGDDDAQAFHNAKQALANLPWYLQPSYTKDDIKLEYDGSVRAGTLSALVERLTVDPLSESIVESGL